MKVQVNGLPCDVCGGAVRHIPMCPTIGRRLGPVLPLIAVNDDLVRLGCEGSDEFYLGVQQSDLRNTKFAEIKLTRKQLRIVEQQIKKALSQF